MKPDACSRGRNRNRVALAWPGTHARTHGGGIHLYTPVVGSPSCTGVGKLCRCDMMLDVNDAGPSEK